jgi:molecular chaperone GrpE
MSEDKNPAEDTATDESQSQESLQAALDKSKRDYLYLLAEFDNFRKNSIKERSDLLKFGAERFVRDLLGVLDNFERALQSNSEGENAQKFREGIHLISEELNSLLAKHGVEAVKSEGQPFDPTVHEALSSEPTDSHPPGTVTRVFKKAYKLHDKLVRPAQVVVATEPPKDK